MNIDHCIFIRVSVPCCPVPPSYDCEMFESGTTVEHVDHRVVGMVLYRDWGFLARTYLLQGIDECQRVRRRRSYPYPCMVSYGD